MTAALTDQHLLRCRIRSRPGQPVLPSLVQPTGHSDQGRGLAQSPQLAQRQCQMAYRYRTTANARSGTFPSSCVPGSRACARLSGIITPRRSIAVLTNPGRRPRLSARPAMPATLRPGTQVGGLVCGSVGSKCEPAFSLSGEAESAGTWRKNPRTDHSGTRFKRPLTEIGDSRPHGADLERPAGSRSCRADLSVRGLS